MRNAFKNYFPLILTLAAIVSVFSGFDFTSSFWLDETLTAWIVSDTFANVSDRVRQYQPMSPLYYWLVWIVQSRCGLNEVSLRIPSIIASIVTLLCCFRFSSQRIGRIPSLLAIVFLASNSDFVSMAVSARPYSLALLCSVLSILAADAWRKQSRPIQLLTALSWITLSFYLHYLAGITTIPVLLLLFCYREGGTRIRLFDGLVFLVWMGSLLPGISHILELGSRSGRYSYAPPLSALRIVSSIVPTDGALILIIGLAIGLVIFPSRIANLNRESKLPLSILILWMTLPVAMLVLLSVVLSDSLLVHRYHLISLVGASLMGGAIVALKREQKFQYVVLTVVAALVMVFPQTWRLEHWREVVESIPHVRQSSAALALVYSGLIEAESSEWILESANHAYLLAPIKVYANEISALPLPRNLQQSYQDAYIMPALQKSDEVTLVVTHSPSEQVHEGRSAVYEDYRTLLIKEGYYEANFNNYGLIASSLFKKAVRP